MPEKETLFLTLEQALEAVRADFHQYDPQIMLLCQTLRLISDGRIATKREPGKNGAWIGEAGRQNMHWLDGPELVRYVCETLDMVALERELMASVCARVFHTRSYADREAETGRTGIRVETGMEDYVCSRCGQCCRTLDYHQELTSTDVARWRETGRDDILAWVRIIEREGREPAYRIWAYPETNRVAEICPFLKREAGENKWGCSIHDARPGICRQYPLSRKHAFMTGCIGFSK
ncbi:MAG: YkgJ family cysteine cluster protein [Deltaproteobacteria bacterium]|nr:YkgJ family cysteine cluster protein [Deltaproteobacteria bacterium]